MELVGVPSIDELGALTGAEREAALAEAGCTVAEIQHAATAVGRLYGVSFGAEGSAHIGGTVATNAGGTGVLRYGNTRDNELSASSR